MEFNEDIYYKLIGRADLKTELNTLMHNTKDDVLVVLRIHLMCENLLEAWICAATHRLDFFNHPQELRLTFNNKLGIAYNLELPKAAYDFLHQINKTRNEFAHKLNKKTITVGLSSKLERIIAKLVPLSPPKMQIMDGDMEVDSLQSESTPERLKLCMIFFLFQLYLTLSRLPETDDNNVTERKTATISFTL
ncbi:hypothetical protein HMH05_02935 [Pseudomonas sp. SbB1]|uniref:Uncharacterized protein n=1 Tax=Pseudomonas putida (strain GB-1) TaxID=76869 RepID=B0KJR6_PSEPG|nr:MULTISPECIES: hypothetical protein [Pseudomonas]ABY99294.1 hypothetical protein PputGB1_3403 [Pseudomonas putida GB-1]MBP0706907.1 hypothetical protein [Pseudomonas sp. T34]MCK2186345.1 hypothetical protein [Pseudomonas sp. MB04B]MDD2083548.1 hypothetical protein [Pseudomonas putida]MDD2093550.1 hypothetical protein [Pseudomonas putida]